MRSLIALLFVVGCAKSAGLPGAAGGESSNDLDALERQLNASEQELGEQVELRLGSLQSTRSQAEGSEAKADKDEAAESSKKPKASAAPEPVAEEAPPAQAPPARATADEPATRESPCEGACRALGSMRRSSERICVLAGAEDARCTRARERVRAAEDRVSKAGCSCS